MACSSMFRMAPSFNPEGIASFSPGLARFREGLPWVTAFKIHNPERVEYQALTKQIQPFQGCDFSVFSPRVARSSQPWAESFNPVGIGKTNDDSFNITCHSTENSEEPRNTAINADNQRLSPQHDPQQTCNMLRVRTHTHRVSFMATAAWRLKSRRHPPHFYSTENSEEPVLL